MSDQSQAVQNERTEKMSEAMIEKLRTVPILSSLKEDELLCLDEVQEIHIQSGDILARQGEVARSEEHTSELQSQ